MRIYGLKNCDTCRKAQKALGDAAILIDVRADSLAEADLHRFLDAFGDALLNTRSTTWRGLDEAQRNRSIPDLLREYPTLMKRPVIEDQSGTLHLGWSKAVQQALGVT